LQQPFDDPGETNSEGSMAVASIGVVESKSGTPGSSNSASGSSSNQTDKKAAPESTSKSDFMTSETHPLRVDFLESSEYPLLRKLGLTFAPGKKQLGAVSGNWDRDLKSDCYRLRHHYQMDTLVSLVEESELSDLGIADLENECRVQGIELIRFPLKDFSVPPSPKQFAVLIREIVKRLKDGKTVAVHCKGGLGRAGLTAACAVIALSDCKVSGAGAIEAVRAARKGAVETLEQETFVGNFSEHWQSFKKEALSNFHRQNSADKEEVFRVACEGGGTRLFRFKADNGKYYFCTEGSSISMDAHDNEEWITWTTGAVETISEGINLLKLGFQIFLFHPTLMHPDYRNEVKEYMENLYMNLSGEEKGRLRRFDAVITPETWFAEADLRMQRKAERDEIQRGKNTEEE